MKTMRDIFEPRHEPAKSIYLAFQTEALKRKERAVDEWIIAERDAVFRECAHQAQIHGLRAPSMEEVAAAERYAMGSTDYGAKWAYQLIGVMKPQAIVPA
jgi:hypothetical protein